MCFLGGSKGSEVRKTELWTDHVLIQTYRKSSKWFLILIGYFLDTNTARFLKRTTNPQLSYGSLQQNMGCGPQN